MTIHWYEMMWRMRRRVVVALCWGTAVPCPIPESSTTAFTLLPPSVLPIVTAGTHRR